MTAGEALPADLQRRFSRALRASMLDGIGTTEALHIFLSNRPGQRRPARAARPVPGYDAAALDDAARGRPRRTRRATSTCAGRRSRPATGSGPTPPPRRSGRVAAHRRRLHVRSADDGWTFLGRNNDMIKAGGIWVSPAEVESVLIEHPDVLEAPSSAPATTPGWRRSSPSSSRAGRDDRRGAIDALPSRMAAFKRLLLKTATGKVQRYRLRDQLAQ